MAKNKLKIPTKNELLKKYGDIIKVASNKEDTDDSNQKTEQL